MRMTWTLAVVCVLVLGGAWFASRALLDDVPTPAAPAPSSVKPVAAPQVDPPMKAAVLPPELAPQREPGTAPVVAQPGSTPVVAKVQPPAAPEDLGPAEGAASPFQGASAELDYAEGILGEATPTQERLQSALGVFKRCVEQEPENLRCHRALALARSKLGLVPDQSVTGKISQGSDREVPGPSLQRDRLNQMRPPARLR